MGLARFSVRELWSRPMRVLLTFLSIVIGVGAVVAVFLSTATTRQAQRDMLQAVSGKADLEILADGPRGVRAEVLDKVRTIPGVKVAVPSINRYAVIYFGKQQARIQVLGIDPAVDQQVRDYEIFAGSRIAASGDLLLDRSFAQSLQITVGSEVKLLTRSGMKDAKVVGLVKPQGESSVTSGATAYISLQAAQQWFRSGKNIDQIQLVLSSGSDVEQVRMRLQHALGVGVTVRTPAKRSQMTEEMMFATENGLHMSIAFALLISLFIIYNSFQMAVGERRKQLGILRAIGTTRRQMTWMILREALWISALAAAVGCLAGTYGARFLTAATERVLQVEMPGVQLHWLPFAVAICFGLGVSLVGAYLPARRASQVQPLEAIRAIEIDRDQALVRMATPLAAATIVLGSILLLTAIKGWLPLGGDIVSVVLILLGIVLLIPVSLHWLSFTLLRLVRPWLGVEAVLAQRQLTRHVGRTTLTIGVLFVASATSVGMAGNVLDNVQNVKQWYSRTIIGDFFVRASMPDMATGAAADLPVGIDKKLAAIDGVESLEGLRFVSARSGESSVLVIVQDFESKLADSFDLIDGLPAEALAGLKGEQVVVGAVLAQRLGLHRGDSIPLETPRGTENLKIAATTNDYLGGGLTIYMHRQLARKLLEIEGMDAFVVQADDRRLASVERELEKVCQESGLILQSYAELVELINGMVSGIIASLWMLLTLGCSIAAMGLVNTLSMSILEQTREIGMLRVVAMTRGQVRRMIFAQALFMGCLGLIPGVLAGSFISYAISLSAFTIIGHNITFAWRPWLILGSLTAGLVVALLASLIPAERAARLKLATALQYE